MVTTAIADWARRLSDRGIETSVRVSQRTGDPVFDANGREEFLDTISLLPVGYVDVSSGFYNIDKRLIYPSLAAITRQRWQETFALANRHGRTQFILSGKSAGAVEVDLSDNVHIGICRDLIANPDYLRDKENGCINAMKCHYYSRGEAHLTCERWDTEKHKPL